MVLLYWDMYKPRRVPIVEKQAKRLFEIKNPLPERLGEVFFEALPRGPGIYKMYSRTGRLHYVGKAKNLRRRLQTYRRARPGRVSRKVIRMVRMTYDISLEETSTEEEALLRENALIREHKPEFNHAKKQPEAYYYIVARLEADRLVTDLRMHVRDRERAFTYGAFKGHGTVRRGLGALLRQLYIMEHAVKRPFDLPSQLMRRMTPMHYELPIPKLRGRMNLEAVLDKWFSGRSGRLQEVIMVHAREHRLLEAFIGKIVLNDMEALHYFRERCARRNYEISEALTLSSPLLPQEKLDDYLVRWAFLEKDGVR